MKAAATEEKPAEDRQQDDLPHEDGHNGRGGLRDLPEIIGGQRYPDDYQRKKNHDRHAGLYDGLQHGIFPHQEGCCQGARPA